MEKQPKAAEVYTGEVEGDVTLEEEPLSEAENDEASEKEASFNSKLSRGREVYNAITENISADKAGVDFELLPTKQKLLYSLFEDEPRKTNQPPARIANIDCHGFHIEDKVFDFTPDDRYDLHYHVIATIAEGATSEDEFCDKLRDANREYHELFADTTKEAIIAEENKLFEAKKAEIIDNYKRNNNNISASTIRSDKIKELCPNLDEETIRKAQSVLDKCQSRAKFARNNLHNNLALYIIERRKQSKEIKQEAAKKSGGKSEEEIVQNYSKIIASAEKRIENDLFFTKKEVLYQEAVDSIAKALDTTIDSLEVGRALRGFERDTWHSPNKKVAAIRKEYLEKVGQLGKENLFGDFMKNNQELIDKACDYDGQRIPKSEVRIRFPELFRRVYKINDEEHAKIYAMKNKALFNVPVKTSRELFSVDYNQIEATMKYNHLINSGKMTREEHHELISASHCTSGYVSKELCNTYSAVNNRRANDAKVRNITNATVALHIAVLRNELENFDESKYDSPLEVFKKVVENKLSEEEEKLFKCTQNEIKHFSHMSIDEAKAELTNIIYSGEDKKREGVANRIDEIAERFRRKNELQRRACDGLAHFGVSLTADDNAKRQAEINAEQALCEHRIDQRIGNNLDAEISQSIQAFGKEVFNIDNAKELFIFPTGLVLRNDLNRFALIPFDVAWQDSISEKMSKNHQNVWQRFLRSDQFNNKKYDTVIRDYINHRIQEECDDNIEFLPDSEKTVNELCEKNNIEQPATINPQSGEIPVQLTEVDARNADELRARYGRYISEFDVNTSGFIPAPRLGGLQNYVKNYVLSGRFDMFFCSKVANETKPTVDIKEYSSCVAQYGDIETEALLVNSISAFVYSQNENKIFPIMKKIMGERANLSPVETIRLTGQKINNLEERKQIACRAYFVSNFNNFLRGDKINDPQMANLIVRLDKMLFDEEE